MPLLAEYYVVLLLYNISKIFSIKKCPVRTLNFPVKSRLFRYLSDLRCMREFEKRRNFHSTTTEDGTISDIVSASITLPMVVKFFRSMPKDTEI